MNIATHYVGTPQPSRRLALRFGPFKTISLPRKAATFIDIYQAVRSERGGFSLVISGMAYAMGGGGRHD